jgi:hypothetical protein
VHVRFEHSKHINDSESPKPYTCAAVPRRREGVRQQRRALACILYIQQEVQDTVLKAHKLHQTVCCCKSGKQASGCSDRSLPAAGLAEHAGYAGAAGSVHCMLSPWRQRR